MMTSEPNNEWEKEFEILPAVNYNLYIGAGKDACDNCLPFEEAKQQIKSFIRSLLADERQRLREEIGKKILPEEAELELGEVSERRHWEREGYNQALSDILKLLDYDTDEK